jgi:hypothetical protein
LDSNSQLFSLSAEFSSQNKWAYKLKFHHAVINKFDDGFYKNPVSAIKEKINLLEAGIEGNIGVGAVELFVRTYDNRPNTPGEKKFGMDFRVTWSKEF